MDNNGWEPIFPTEDSMKGAIASLAQDSANDTPIPFKGEEGWEPATTQDKSGWEPVQQAQSHDGWEPVVDQQTQDAIKTMTTFGINHAFQVGQAAATPATPPMPTPKQDEQWDPMRETKAEYEANMPLLAKVGRSFKNMESLPAWTSLANTTGEALAGTVGSVGGLMDALNTYSWTGDSKAALSVLHRDQDWISIKNTLKRVGVDSKYVDSPNFLQDLFQTVQEGIDPSSEAYFGNSDSLGKEIWSAVANTAVWGSLGAGYEIGKAGVHAAADAVTKGPLQKAAETVQDTLHTRDTTAGAVTPPSEQLQANPFVEQPTEAQQPTPAVKPRIKLKTQPVVEQPTEIPQSAATQTEIKQQAEPPTPGISTAPETPANPQLDRLAKAAQAIRQASPEEVAGLTGELDAARQEAEKAGIPSSQIIKAITGKGGGSPKTPQQLVQMLESANLSKDNGLAARAEAETQVVGPRTLEPVKGTGEVKQRGLSQSIEAKAIESQLTDTFGELPGYQAVTVSDQAAKALDILKQDPKQAKDIAMGNTPAPQGVLPESVLVAVEKDALARGDVDTLRDLAMNSRLTTESTTMGQRLAMLADRGDNSPVAAIKKLQLSRTQALSEKGVDVAKETQKIATDAKNSATKAMASSKPTWEAFVKSITCKS